MSTDVDSSIPTTLWLGGLQFDVVVNISAREPSSVSRKVVVFLAEQGHCQGQAYVVVVPCTVFMLKSDSWMVTCKARHIIEFVQTVHLMGKKENKKLHKNLSQEDETVFWHPGSAT